MLSSGRDYFIAPMSRAEQSSHPKTVKIEPAYDLLEEPDFNLPTTGNFIYPPKGLHTAILSVLSISIS